jgi:hypothetical protein
VKPSKELLEFKAWHDKTALEDRIAISRIDDYHCPECKSRNCIANGGWVNLEKGEPLPWSLEDCSLIVCLDCGEEHEL